MMAAGVLLFPLCLDAITPYFVLFLYLYHITKEHKIALTDFFLKLCATYLKAHAQLQSVTQKERKTLIIINIGLHGQPRSQESDLCQHGLTKQMDPSV